MDRGGPGSPAHSAPQTQAVHSTSTPGLANIPTCKESFADVSEAVVELGTERDSGRPRRSGSGSHQSAGSQPQKKGHRLAELKMNKGKMSKKGKRWLRGEGRSKGLQP